MAQRRTQPPNQPPSTCQSAGLLTNNQMKTTHKIAYNYCQAMITQRAAEEQVSQAFVALGSDNQIFGLAEPIESAYTELVHELIGPELFDWLMWWMYETEHGKLNMQFTVSGVEYNPQDLTLYSFLQAVDPS